MTDDRETENTPERLLARAYALRNDDPEETLKLYADWAETYDQTMIDGLAYRSPRRIAALAAVSEPRRDARVLDVGCGTGALTLAAQRACPESSLVVGVDPSEEMRGLARRAGVQDVRPGSFEFLPFDDGSFDLVVSGYAIRYAEDLQRTACELHRLLRPRGRLVLLEMIAPSSPHRRALVGRAICGFGAPVLGALCGTRSIRDLMRHFWESVAAFALPERVVEHLVDAGFEEAEYRPLGGLLGEFRAVRPDDDV